jgi:hypothetical protein
VPIIKITEPYLNLPGGLRFLLIGISRSAK